MKTIATRGITYIEPLAGSCEWYWGCDYATGDLYEAEELYRDGHPVTSDRLVFVHYPDGRVVEPILAKEGQYFGRPIFCDGKIQILMADFPKGSLNILQYDDGANRVTETVSLPLSAVEDCYNLLLKGSPLMLTRQGTGGRFEVVWPERVAIDIGETETLTESFYERRDGKLYFCRWQDEPEYREEIVVRSYPDGEILEVIPGARMEMPDGQIWVLQ